MPTSPLTPTGLADYPGAPFTQSKIDSAVALVRRVAGWHIAPVVTETLTLDSEGGRTLLLPSLRVTSVTEVRDVSSSTPRVLTDWRLSSSGMLSRPGGWPEGFSTVEVDLSHGYDEWPSELLRVVAEATQRQVRQESLGSRSATFDPDAYTTAVMALFTIPNRP